MSANSAISPRDVKKDGVSTVAGVVTNSAISRDFYLDYGSSRNLRITVVVSSVTVVGNISIKFQHAAPGQSFEDLASAGAVAVITADGVYHITLNIEDSTDVDDMPLMQRGRVVITNTNASDTVDVDNVYFYEAN